MRNPAYYTRGDRTPERNPGATGDCLSGRPPGSRCVRSAVTQEAPEDGERRLGRTLPDRLPVAPEEKVAGAGTLLCRGPYPDRTHRFRGGSPARPRDPRD